MAAASPAAAQLRAGAVTLETSLVRVVLINTNQVKPAVAPIGLDYIGEVLSQGSHQVDVLDLCWSEDPLADVAAFFRSRSADLVGVTLRNSDDCDFGTRKSFVAPLAELVSTLRAQTDARVVLGGAGFSVMPEAVLEHTGADAGVWGDGELAFPQLAQRVADGQAWDSISNLVWRDGETWRRNTPLFPSLERLPPMTRRFVDSPRYHQQGEPVGVETKRGCPCECIYCADPLAKGSLLRPRAPKAVADELEALLNQGVDGFQTCDSEFNQPEWHATQVCEEIIGRGLGDRFHWQAMCTPMPFSAHLAGLMRRAGCTGVNLGADNGDADMLCRLKRPFAPEDILNAVRACRAAGIEVMVDLLLGAPGETRESIEQSLELMRRAGPDKVNVALGLRVYPGTDLERMVSRPELQEGLVGGPDPLVPLYYVDAAVAPFASELINAFISEAYARKIHQRRAAQQALLRGPS